MNEQFVLEYYDGEIRKEIPIRLKFLTPSLRVKIIQHDTATQLAFKKYEQEVLKQEAFRREEELQTKINQKIEEIKRTSPYISDEEVEIEKSKFLLELVKDITEEELKERETTLIKHWMYNDEWNIKFFKLIVDVSSLPEEHKRLILSSEDSDFWKNVNISKVTEINRFFRGTHSI